MHCVLFHFSNFKKMEYSTPIFVLFVKGLDKAVVRLLLTK